ncbi:hypothetical protein F4859DRAFT_468835, partial [Xylaria cf. heliscus]
MYMLSAIFVVSVPGVDGTEASLGLALFFSGYGIASLALVATERDSQCGQGCRLLLDHAGFRDPIGPDSTHAELSGSHGPPIPPGFPRLSLPRERRCFF